MTRILTPEQKQHKAEYMRKYMRGYVYKKPRKASRGYARKYHSEVANADPNPERRAAKVAGMVGYYSAVDSIVSRRLQVDPWFVPHLPCRVVDFAIENKPLEKWMKKKVNTAQNATLGAWGYTVATRRRVISKVLKTIN